MKISLDKLEKLLSEKDMIISRFFLSERKKCKYVEITSTKNTIVFILSVSSSYEINLGDATNYVILKDRKIYDNSNVFDQYVDKERMIGIETNYEAFQTNEYDKTYGNIEKDIEDKYNKTLSLFNKDRNVGNNILRQLRRLGLCMNGTKYNLSICVNDLFFIGENGNKVKGFRVDDDYKSDTRKVRVVIDIGLLHDRMDLLDNNILEIHKNLIKIMTSSINKHVKITNSFVNTNSLSNIVESLDKNTEIINDKIKELVNVLNGIRKDEINLIEKKLREQNDINKKFYTRAIKKELDYEKVTSTYTLKLNELRNIKQKTVDDIINMKEQYMNKILVYDDLIFETVVMVETIKSNISKFSQNI